MLWQNAHFLGSFQDARECPKEILPEYAFIGRSNVGKSSLINMLLGRKELAKTSKKPGKTRAINIFRIDGEWTLADLPGYGYAQVSKTSRKQWQKMIEHYLQNRQQLACTFVLLDVRHSLQANDEEFMNWLGLKQIPFVICFTKSDKLKPSERKAKISQLLKGISSNWDPLPTYFITSAEDGEGGEEVNGFIRQLNEQLKEEGRIPGS